MDTSFVGGTLITGGEAYMIIPPELYKRLMECDDDIADIAHFVMYLTSTMRLDAGYLVHGNSLEAGHWTKTSTEWYALGRIISNTALISWNYRIVKVNLPHGYCKAGSNEWKPMY